MENLKGMLPLLVLIFPKTLNSLFKKQLSKAGYLCGYLEHEVSTHPDLGSPLDMSRNNGTDLSVSDLNLASVHSQRCYRLRATQQSFRRLSLLCQPCLSCRNGDTAFLLQPLPLSYSQPLLL